jgi:hypothetical protein
MGKKYLDTKEGSLEQSILGLWQEAAGVKKEKLDPVGKEDGDIDNDGDKDSSDKYLMKRRKAIKKSMSKKEGNAFGMALKSAKDNGEKTFVVSGKKYNVEDYDVKEDVALDENGRLGFKDIEKLGRSAASRIDNEARRTSGYDKMSAGQKDELRYKIAKKLGMKVEDVDLDEASVMVDLENDDKKLMSDIKKMGIKVKDLGDSGNPGYNEYKLTGSPAALKKGGKKFGWDQQTEEVKLDEASVMVDLENDNPKLMKDIKKMGIKVKDLGDSGNRGYNEYKLTGSPAALKKGGKKFGWDQQVEKVQVKELIGAVPAAIAGYAAGKVMSGKKHLAAGKMSQMHQLIKDKKSAEEISKIMRLDLKSVKALMANYMSAGYHESYEWGTDELRKHTEDVTPGQDGDWVDAQKGKNDSMREALAKVWQTDEGKNPFKKESKKDLTKEVKDGKTMTGKKVASVDINPTIKEKKK